MTEDVLNQRTGEQTRPFTVGRCVPLAGPAPGYLPAPSTPRPKDKPMTEARPIHIATPPAPPPASAEAMLQALIKTNQSERDIVQSNIDALTEEANRLDTIRRGLDGALVAARASAARSIVQGQKPPSAPSHAAAARTDWRG